ncbi:MAG: hydrolase 2, exosortase A system-associated, partial [Polaromonas sp.]
MNKSRRMAALQARALAGAGFDVLQIDLLGCGDSSGDFGDATWQSWVSDVVQACHWLQNRSDMHDAGSTPAQLWLWGLRAGCLLAVEAARQLKRPCNFLFWQPPASGKTLLQQFLRLKVA